MKHCRIPLVGFLNMWLLSNNVLIKDSGLLEGMTDYHCHLLPGVDDGVQKLDETIEILKLWEQVGVKNVWLTPHIMEDIPNNPEDLNAQFEILLKHYDGSITLSLSAENMMDNLLSGRIKEKRLLPLGHKGEHLLVETSYFNPPYDMDEILFAVRGLDYQPVLAHPERYDYMSIGDYESLKKQDIMFQLNIPSIVGVYGETVKKKAEMLLEKGYYDLYGTDTHSIRFVKHFLQAKINKKTLKAVRELIESHQI